MRCHLVVMVRMAMFRMLTFVLMMSMMVLFLHMVMFHSLCPSMGQVMAMWMLFVSFFSYMASVAMML